MKSPNFVMRESGNDRSLSRSHRAAAPTHRVLQGHQRRRPLGRALHRFGQPSFCVVIEGRCRLAVDGQETIMLRSGRFRASAGNARLHHDRIRAGDARAHGSESGAAPDRRGPARPARGRPDVRLLGGYFVYDSPDAALLVSLLPALVHVRGMRAAFRAGATRQRRIAASRASGRELVLTRLVEVLLIEALRATPGDGRAARITAWPGRSRESPMAIRQMHRDPRGHGRWSNSRGKPDCRVQPSSTASRGRGHGADGVPARLAHGSGKGLLRGKESG